MQYVCLVHVDGEAMAALSKEEGARLTDETIAHDWDLRQGGKLVLARPLQSPETAAIVCVRAGHTTVTDGPYAEAKEFLGGFLIVEARDMEEAIELAQACPMARMGSIEVRPFLHQTHSETGRERPPL